MNRTDLQTIAEIRVQEATALRDQGHRQGAYYLLGYAVECALKACIAKQIREHDFPDKRLIQGSYTHDLKELLNLSGLKGNFKVEVGRNKAFSVNWEIVEGWNEAFRYRTNVEEMIVNDFFAAVLDGSNGVLPWLKRWW